LAKEEMIMACSFQPDALAKYFVPKGPDGKKVTSGGTKFAHFTNPIQSQSIKNCHLISALSSLAWVNKAIFTPDRGTATVVNFTFYDFAPGSVTPRKVYVNSNLFSDGTNPCGATSNNWDTVDHESWPALWEKAFAKFCMYKILKNPENQPYYSLEDLQNSAKDPVYSLLPKGSDWGGNPVTVMNWILNKPALDYSPYNKSFTYGASTYTNFYDFIKNGICKTPNIPADCNGAKTLSSMGAWTYLNEGSAKLKTGVSISYSDATLVADHSYALLGVYENYPYRYIVLRNPYGKNDPTGLPVGPGSWKYKEGASILTFDFTPNDGVFALEETTFKNYFERFGVVG
jgi:hypothetical protein